MDKHLEKHYADLYRALGMVVHEWAWLEASVSNLVFDLCALKSQSFYRHDGIGDVTSAIHANLDLRTNIAIAKALAFNMDDPPGIWNRIDATLNMIGNALRNERNRYVHDRWLVASHDRIVRFEFGTKLPKKPGSGEQELSLGRATAYSSISDVESLAVKISNQRIALNNLQDELQEAYERKYPAEG